MGLMKRLATARMYGQPPPAGLPERHRESSRPVVTLEDLAEQEAILASRLDAAQDVPFGLLAPPPAPRPRPVQRTLFGD